jgi:ribonuclease P protein component
MRSFKRQNKLNKASDFKRVFSRGKKKFHKGITLIVCPNEDFYARLGFAISKKQIRTAVARNRFKRIAKEEFRSVKDRLEGFDFIVLVNKTCLDYNKATIHQYFHRLFNDFVPYSNISSSY